MSGTVVLLVLIATQVASLARAPMSHGVLLNTWTCPAIPDQRQLQPASGCQTRTFVTRIALAVLAFLAFLPAPALAEPNDFRVVSGTLLHPVRLGSDAAVAVLQSDEGTVYYADLRAVSGIPTLERGAAVTLVGFEGSRPDQLAAQAIYPPDLTPADAPSVRSERIDGRIEALAGDTVVLVRATDGHEVTILLRGVSINIRDLLQRGDAVTVFGQPSETDFLVTGIIQRQD